MILLSNQTVQHEIVDEVAAGTDQMNEVDTGPDAIDEVNAGPYQRDEVREIVLIDLT